MRNYLRKIQLVDNIPSTVLVLKSIRRKMEYHPRLFSLDDVVVLDQAIVHLSLKAGMQMSDLPKPDIVLVGTKTVLRNIREISKALNRSPEQIINYLCREWATAGTLEGTRAIIHGRFDTNTFIKYLSLLRRLN